MPRRGPIFQLVGRHFDQRVENDHTGDLAVGIFDDLLHEAADTVTIAVPPMRFLAGRHHGVIHIQVAGRLDPNPDSGFDIIGVPTILVVEVDLGAHDFEIASGQVNTGHRSGQASPAVVLTAAVFLKATVIIVVAVFTIVTIITQQALSVIVVTVVTIGPRLSL